MRRLLPLLAILSLLPAAVLAFGYVGTIGVDVQDSNPAGPQPVYRDRDVAVEAGRIRCYSTTATATPKAGRWPTARVVPGRHVWLNLRVDPKLDLKRSIWDADSHLLVNAPPVRTYLYAAPIWCFLWPWLIAPLLWFRMQRRGRRRAEASGFEVVTSLP